MSWILKGLLFYGFTVLLFYCFMLNFKFYHNIIPSSTIFLIRITNSILFILKNVNKRIYIIQSMAGLFPLNVMNRSSLIILKLLKLSYCSQACKLSIKNNLDFKLNHYRKKKKLNDSSLIKIDLIKFHLTWILSDITTKIPFFNSQRNDIFEYMERSAGTIFCSRERIDKRMA